MGNPVLVQQAFDFKFPCMNLEKFSFWRTYEHGPYQGARQDRIYQQFLGITAKRVQPRLGVEP
jgi:hypothetical protein